MPEPSLTLATRAWYARPERWLALVACGFAGFCFAAVALVIPGWFHPVTVVPLALVVSAALAWCWGDWARVPIRRADPRWFWALALVVAVGSVGVNARWANEHTSLNRDPGTYFNAALVLRDHGAPTYRVAAGGFARRGDVTQAAGGILSVDAHHDGFLGLHLLPAIGAASGWVAGDNGLARAPALLGGLFLLFLMGFGLRLVGPRWSLLAGISFALLVPFAYGARDYLSEMVLGPALFAALWLLPDVLDDGSPRRALLPGALLGAAAMARIDAPLTLIGVLVFFGLWLLGVGRDRVRVMVAVLVPTLVGVVLAAGDGWINARDYITDHRGELLGEAALLALPVIVLLVLHLTAGRWRPALVPWWERHRRQLAVGVAVLVGVIVVVGLFVRPEVQDVHAVPSASLVEELQKLEHLPVDGTASYDQDSMRWMVWYLGPIAFLAAMGAIAWMLHRLLQRGLRAVEALALAAVGAPMAIYLYRPSIYPDHPWVTRRFLPIVFPMLVLLAAWCAWTLWHVRPSSGPEGRAGRAQVARRVGAVAIAAGAIVGPLMALAPIWRFQTYDDQLGQVRQVCGVLPNDAAVMVVADPYAINARSISEVCDVPVAAYTPNGGLPHTETLDAIAAGWRRDHRVLWVVSLNPALLRVWGVKHATLVRRSTKDALQSSLKHRPDRLIEREINLSVAEWPEPSARL